MLSSLDASCAYSIELSYTIFSRLLVAGWVVVWRAMIVYSRYLGDSPTLKARFLLTVGTAVLMYGSWILIAFTPNCPTGCSCTGSVDPSTYAQPVCLLMMGVSWIYCASAIARTAPPEEITPPQDTYILLEDGTTTATTKSGEAIALLEAA